ncbi:MAG: hypothetical protein HY907_16065 [Deltaproteobacteria bacterium]|nr:hypothetical protein [Deltaproteobacteria bacterium]
MSVRTSWPKWTAPLLLLGIGSGCFDTLDPDAFDVPPVEARDSAEDGDADAPDEADAPTDVPPPECTTDDDCIVALNEERCCDPDPLAVPRSRLAEDHCLHELGTAWTDTHDDCWRECYACGPIGRRFYDARCDAGRCIGVDDACAPTDAPPSAGIFDAAVTPRGGWEQYRGRLLTLHGWPSLGPTSSACTPEPDACFDSPVQRTIACQFTLRGSTCGVPWSCSGSECDASCTPEPTWGELWLDGYLVDTDADGWEFWPITSPEECAPRGPNPEGAACTPFEDGDCAAGLFCFFWGDVLAPCIGECRTEGTECLLETDCPPGETCYHGYCEWCCPG